MATYLLSISGGCPDILLVGVGSSNSLPPFSPLVPFSASGPLAGNTAYRFEASGSEPLVATAPPCTNPGDSILIDVAPGKGDVSIKGPDGSTLWAVPGPHPQSVLKLTCDGSEWEVIE